jgi:hypothetical protein
MSARSTDKVYDHNLVYVHAPDRVIDLGWISFFFSVHSITLIGTLFPYKPIRALESTHNP